MKKIILSLLLTTLLAAASNPGNALRDMIDFVSSIKTKQQIIDRVESCLDFKTISADIAGRKAWLAADSNTRDLFIKKIKSYLSDYYADNLSILNKYRFVYTARPSSLRQTIKVYNPNGSTATLVMFYRSFSGKWLIVDSSYNGLSMVSFWRSKFSDTIRSKGLLGI